MTTMKVSTMTSCEPHVGEVWLTYLHFTDHPDIGKVRPVVIVEVSDNELVVLKITSKAPHPERRDVIVSDLVSAGLRQPSSIWITPPFVLQRSDLLRDAPIGILSPEDWQAVDRALVDAELSI